MSAIPPPRQEWAPSYAAGQQLLQSEQYDAVLIDYDLGPHTGLDLIRQTVSTGYPAPLILFTGRGNYAVDVEATQAGATLYLTKSEATPLLMERFLRYAIEQKRSQQQLQAAEHKYRLLAENSPDIIYIIDLKSGKNVYLNSATLLGYTREELEAPGSILSRVHPDDLPALQAHWSQVLGGAVPGAIEYRLQLKDGSWEWLSSRDRILTRDAHGQPTELMSTLTLITARKQADAQLALQASLLEQVHNSVIAIDLNNTIIYWNASATQLYQWTRQEALGQNIIELLAAEENREAANQNLNHLYRHGHWEGIFNVRRKDGSTLVSHITNTYLKDTHGENIGFIGISEDITQHLATERALRERDSLYRSVLHAAMDGFWLADLHARLLEVNEAYCQMSGYTQAELLTMTVADLEAGETPAQTARHTQKIIAQGRDRFTTRHRRKDGSTFAVEVSVHYQPECGGRMISFLRPLPG